MTHERLNILFTSSRMHSSTPNIVWDIFDTIDSTKFLKPDVYNKMLNAHVTVFLYHHWDF